METGPRLKVSSDRLVKPGIEPATPGLQGKRFIHYTTTSEDSLLLYVEKFTIAQFEGLQRDPSNRILLEMVGPYFNFVCYAVNASHTYLGFFGKSCGQGKGTVDGSDPVYDSSKRRPLSGICRNIRDPR